MKSGWLNTSIRVIATPLLLSMSLGACSTFSFGPPRVEVNKAINLSGNGGCAQDGDAKGAPLGHNQAGALNLIDNFVLAYRCAAHDAADGRQIFEVPSMLALIAAAVGPTFGLTNDGRIAAATSAAVLSGGKSYYAPKDKAHILDAALDAVLCVQTRAVGVAPFVTADTKGRTSDQIDPELQYFKTVSAALFSIERLLAKRLSNAGAIFDASSLQAEIEKLKAEEDSNGDEAAKRTAGGFGRSGEELNIERLQINLQQCVNRAKLT